MKEGAGAFLQTDTTEPSRSVPGRARTQTHRVVIIEGKGAHRKPAVSNASAICHPCADPGETAPANRDHRDITGKWTGRALENELWGKHAC